MTLPTHLRFTNAMASSSVAASTMPSTGPKTSSAYAGLRATAGMGGMEGGIDRKGWVGCIHNNGWDGMGWEGGVDRARGCVMHNIFSIMLVTQN